MSKATRLLYLVLAGVVLGAGLAALWRHDVSPRPWTAVTLGLLMSGIGAAGIVMVLYDGARRRRPAPASHPCAGCAGLPACDLRRDLKPGQRCNFRRSTS